MKQKPKPSGRSCPRCKVGEMLLRKGKFGEFYGCSKYPYCTHKEKVGPSAGSGPAKSALEAQADEFLKQHGCGDLVMKS